MDKVIELFVDMIKKNFKKPQFYFFIISFLAIVFLIFPYIDANIFYYNRIEKRASVLKELVELDIEKIQQNQVLNEEYQSILAEVNEQKYRYINNIIVFNKNEDSRVKWWKFISGGMLTWILTLCVPFMNTFKNTKDKLLGFILLMLLGGLIGCLGWLIPSFLNPWINYVGFPIVQLAIIVLFAINSK